MRPHPSPATPTPDGPRAGEHLDEHLDATEERNALRAVTIFPVLILVAGLVGYAFSGAISPAAPAVNPLLGVIMFGMGLTLTLPDVALVGRRPVPVVLGVVAQFVIMPLAGVAVAKLLGLAPDLAAGVILVGCAPGGTASNVICYLAKADVALSVTMTSISTLLAPLLTPALALWLAGEDLPVSFGSLAGSILQIVLVPVVAGLLVRLFAARFVERVLPALPWISVATVSVVVAIVVSGSASKVVSAGPIVLLAVVLHNGLGLALGYGAARALRQPVRVARTTAVEVGMQNSGLAAGLAAKYVDPTAALPGAVFSIWHNVSGSLLATAFRRQDARRGH